MTALAERVKGIGNKIGNFFSEEIPDWTKGENGEDLGLRVEADMIRNTLLTKLDRWGIIVGDKLLMGIGKSHIVAVVTGGFYQDEYGHPQIDTNKFVSVEKLFPTPEESTGKMCRGRICFSPDFNSPPYLLKTFKDGQESIEQIKDLKTELPKLIQFLKTSFVLKLNPQLAADFLQNYLTMDIQLPFPQFDIQPQTIYSLNEMLHAPHAIVYL